MGTSSDFSSFLRQVLPPIGYSWRRLDRRNVRRRVLRRMDSLGVHELERYAALLARDTVEKAFFESLLRISITRFFRNARLWQELFLLLKPAADALPGEMTFRVWSAGCAGGEEPFTASIMFLEEREGGRWERPWSILATDSDPAVLRRARENRSFAFGSVREVPERLRDRWFARRGDSWVLNEAVPSSVRFRRHDLLREDPPGRFHLILMRNSILTYNIEPAQRRVLDAMRSCLETPGLLVIGRTERIPDGWGWEREGEMVYRKKQS